MISFNINKKDVQEIPKCFVCDSKRNIILANVYYKNEFIIFQTTYCNRCSHIYRSIRPKISWLEKAWKKRERIQLKNKISYVNSSIEKKRERRYKKIFKFLSNKIEFKSILDVGCGPGTGLKHLTKNKNVFGLEPDKTRAKIAIKNKIKIINSKIENISTKEKFDLVTCIQSLEHFYNPRICLESMKKIIKEDGYIFIEVPNFFNHVKSWHDSIYLGHMSNFTKKSFLEIFYKCRLEPKYLCYTQTGRYGEYNLAILAKKNSSKKKAVVKIKQKYNQKKIYDLYLKDIKFKKKIPLNFNINIINDLSLMYKPNQKINTSLIQNIFERSCHYNKDINKFEISLKKSNQKKTIKRNKIDKNIKFLEI